MAAPQASRAAAPAELASWPTGGACLSLQEWESCRVQVHTARRKIAESTLYRLNLRTHNGLAALDAWLAVLEMRRKLGEVAAAATARGIDELEGHWRPVRLPAIDGGPAEWLLAAERAHASDLAQHSARWAAAKPAGLDELKGRYKALTDQLAAEAVSVLQAWDAAHDVASQVWSGHSERLEAAAQAIAKEQAPPDSWLSEVRYREHARSHVARQAAAEDVLGKSLAALEALEQERAKQWDIFVALYVDAGGTVAPNPLDGGPRQDMPVPPVCPQAADGKLGVPLAASQESLPVMPEMPGASGAVLLRTRVAMQAPSGLFGLGGSAWREGATLVLTLHGYLHLFFFERPSKERTEAAEGGPSEDEELVEAAIRASVYVPLATRCVFLSKGKERSLDLAEAEAAEAQPAAGPTGALRRWMTRSGNEAQPLPRRIQARVADAEAFAALEQRCHEFVRRGQGLRNAAAAAAATAAAASAGPEPEGRGT